MAKKIKNKFFCDTYLDMEHPVRQKSTIEESQGSWDGGDMPQVLKGASAHVAHARHNSAWGAREGAGTGGRWNRDRRGWRRGTCMVGVERFQ